MSQPADILISMEQRALTHPNPLERLRVCRLIVEQRDGQALVAIKEAREQGVSWEEIGALLSSRG